MPVLPVLPAMKECAHCKGSGWLSDVALPAAKAAAGVGLRAAATSLGGPAAGMLAHGALSMAGMGVPAKARKAKGRPKKLFDRFGNEVPRELIRGPKRQVSDKVRRRNAAVKALALQRGVSIIDASRALKAEGLPY